ncbi:DJ-1/PfpI family protein [Avibacterium paragallinarum]|uniref:DJ-1/PfpI family protein n=1 Tax=Avibacterium paragallinarum TaxID=728 RepID=UPI0021F7B243|nr:DJ-1/PfpI family protein [Avibacterium paragallinarum]UXN35583.1 DJ-1/PfpI family protein [Avibacterium paragallinarum]
MQVNTVLFDQFLELDVFGAFAVFKNLGFSMYYLSANGGKVRGACGAVLETQPWQQADGDILLIPGGAGTCTLVQNQVFLAELAKLCQSYRFVLSVCTGSALLAASGVLNGKTATTNLNAFDWGQSLNPQVRFVRQRVCQDGQFFTSAGVSAGIEMALHFTAYLFDNAKAEAMAKLIEYEFTPV